jgi:hypothetical protein
VDQHEASLICERYLADHSLTELYDQVMIPALILAEQDRHKGRLEDGRDAGIFLGASELLAQLAESERQPEAEPRSKLPAPVYVIPAMDRADEIAAAMLVQISEGAPGPGIRALPAGTLPRKFRTPDATALFCVSAVPPFAIAPARAVCLKLRTRFPTSRIIVGIWGSKPEGRGEQHLRNLADAVVSTLDEAKSKILGLPAASPGEGHSPRISAEHDLQIAEPLPRS